MDKEIVIKDIVKLLWFTLAIALIIGAYYVHLQYNLDQSIDAFSSATQVLTNP